MLCNLETAVSRSMPQNLYNLSPKRAHIYNLSMWPTWGDLLCSAIYVSFTTRPKLCTEYTQSYHSPSQGVESPERKYLYFVFWQWLMSKMILRWYSDGNHGKYWWNWWKLSGPVMVYIHWRTATNNLGKRFDPHPPFGRCPNLHVFFWVGLP